MLGIASFEAGDYEGAETDLKETIALAPEFAYAHTVLGENYRAQKQSQQALAAYRKATAMDATDGRPYLGLAAIYTDRGRFRQAINACETALRLNPSPPIVIA